MKSIACLLALAAVAAPVAAFARPAPAAHAEGVDYASLVADPARSAEHRALDESRMPGAVLAFAAFRRGWTVADWSAGSGYYSVLIAGAVGPTGRVLALGQPRYYKPESWAALTAAHPNVVPVIAANLALAPRSVDAIFAHLTFHDLFHPPRPGEPVTDPATVLANWFAAVKPGGVVVIADHRGEAGNTGEIAGTLHRIDLAVASKAMTAAGFVALAGSDVLRRSEDDLTRGVFDPAVRGRTDRFLLKFRRP